MISLTGKRSFSLIELLVATAILSVGIVAVLQALSFLGRVAGLSFDIANAILLTENKMQEWEFKEKQGMISNEPKEGKGTVDKFDWEYILNFEPDLKLYSLNFNIGWKRAERQEKINLNTYLR